jgi:hypothetical protein
MVVRNAVKFFITFIDEHLGQAKSELAKVVLEIDCLMQLE